jgi:hypothetical protein
MKNFLNLLCSAAVIVSLAAAVSFAAAPGAAAPPALGFTPATASNLAALPIGSTPGTNLRALLAAPQTPTRASRGGAAGPYDEQQIKDMLAAHIAQTDIATRARHRGISFVLTAAVQTDLKAAGADAALLAALAKIQPRGLVWQPPRRLMNPGNAAVDISNLVSTDRGRFLAFTGSDKHVYLATDAAGGPWKLHPVYSSTPVGNGPNQSYVALAVSGSSVYVPFVTVDGTQNVAVVAYSASNGDSGTWHTAALYRTDASYLNNPSAVVMGGTLYVSFDTPPAKKGNNDVLVASVALSTLPASGVALTTPLARVVDLTQADDVSGGPEDDYAQLAPAGGQLAVAWQRAHKNLVFTQFTDTGVPLSVSPTLLHTAGDEADQSLQLATNGATMLMARFVENPDRNSALGEQDVWATTNAGGTWNTEVIGRTNLALQKPGVAVGKCGPSIAFDRALSGNSGRLTVATWQAGRWVGQSLAMTADQPRLAVTPDGLDMTYFVGGVLYYQHAKCYPPPEPLIP